MLGSINGLLSGYRPYPAIDALHLFLNCGTRIFSGVLRIVSVRRFFLIEVEIKSNLIVLALYVEVKPGIILGC